MRRLRFTVLVSLLVAATFFLASRPLRRVPTPPQGWYLGSDDPDFRAHVMAADVLLHLLFDERKTLEQADFALARARNEMGLDWMTSAREFVEGQHLHGMSKGQVKAAIGLPAFESERRWIYIVADYFLSEDFGMQLEFDSRGQVSVVALHEMLLSSDATQNARYFARLAREPLWSALGPETGRVDAR